MTALLSFAGKSWPVILLGLAGVATWATIMVLRAEVERLEKDVIAARIAAATEAGNVDRLEILLAEAQAAARKERQAREAAAEQREADRTDNQAADVQLGETIVIEREADVTLDQCLGYELPDSILRDLP